MIFESHRVTKPLSDYIESIFYYKDIIPDHSIERVIPTGHVFILFELDGFTRHTYDNETLKPNNSYQKVWISGMHQNYISISAHQKSEMLVIQFKPYGAYPFFHFPTCSLNERVVHTQDLFKNELLDLQLSILNEKQLENKFLHVEQWLYQRFQQIKTPPSELITLIESLQKNSKDNMKNLIEEYSKSQKHLIDQIKKYAGLTPKYLQRIFRFNELLQNIHKNDKIEWAHVALDCGYSDQSHFIKEFKHFCGINPKQFISEKLNYEPPNFFALDKLD
jgi:AraC-like DNA-binding protein